jgi:hypothetical protein
MKKILTLSILIISAIACEKVETLFPKIEQVYTVQPGGNIFAPVIPIEPTIKNHIEYDVVVGKEWWAGNLTEPPGYGCKLNAIGKFNYHAGGANFAIGYENGEVYLWPRYYEPITSGTYILHELTRYRIKMNPDEKVSCKIVLTNTTDFYINSALVVSVPVTIPGSWICQPFLGRSGTDNNYPGGPIPGAFSVRKLGMKITLS